jgi:hypothetical protein
LNIDLGNNNERQDCRTGTECWGSLWVGGMNVGVEEEGIRPVVFIYVKKK